MMPYKHTVVPRAACPVWNSGSPQLLAAAPAKALRRKKEKLEKSWSGWDILARQIMRTPKKPSFLGSSILLCCGSKLGGSGRSLLKSGVFWGPEVGCQGIVGEIPEACDQQKWDALSHLPSLLHGPHLSGQWTPRFAHYCIFGHQHPKPHFHNLNSGKLPRSHPDHSSSHWCYHSLLEDQVQKVRETTQMQRALTFERYPLVWEFYHQNSPLASSEWHQPWEQCL